VDILLAGVNEESSGMNQDLRSKLEHRVVTAAQAALARQKVVSPVDVLVGIGWLPSGLVDDWRRGRVDHLELVAAVPAERLAAALGVLCRWAQSAGLQPSEVAYVSATRDQRPLRFTATGDSNREQIYRTHWTSPQLSETARERLTQRQNTPPDLVVVSPLGDWTCADCGGTGTLLVMDNDMPLCLTCTDMDHLIFLPSGDAALTRRAKKASTLSAVVVRFSRARKRYERQGILVEQAALEAAEQQCLGDEDARQRRRERDRESRAGQDLALMSRMTQEIIRLYPACPAPRAESIAAHTSVRGSGRVGRSAAGRALANDAITRAVIASVRHEDTDYDRLLMSGVPRADARERVREGIDRVLDAWRGQP
jgi:hypothetical protein